MLYRIHTKEIFKVASNLLQFFLWCPLLSEPVQLQTFAVVTLFWLLKVTALNLQSLHCLHGPHHLLFRLDGKRTHIQNRGLDATQIVTVLLYLEGKCKNDFKSGVSNWIFWETD